MTDWATRIKDLESSGWSLKGIGEEVGLSTSSVSDIKRRATVEPRGMAAVKLHELHARVCTPLDQLPEALEEDPARRTSAASERGEAAEADELSVQDLMQLQVA